MKRVLVAQIMHETNTFSRLPTDEEAYRRRYLVPAGEMIARFRGTETELGGFVDAAERHGWDLVPAIAANATPSGKVTAACWAMLQDAVLQAADNGPIDGVCLAMHGAMVTETEDDAEGALLARLREKLGPDVPIALTLDLHANVSEAMAEHASFVVSYRTYPHIDQRARANQAADLVEEVMQGRRRSICTVGRAATLDGWNHGRTQEGPFVEALARADAFEREPGIHVVSLQAGFGWSDVPFAGPSVIVSHDPAAKGRAEAIITDLLDHLWRTREQNTVPHLPLEAAMAEARVVGEAPLVIADATDNPGAGGYADATNLLKAMLEAGVQNAAFATIVDPAAVAVGERAGVGATLEVDLGGHVDPAYGAPLRCRGVVRHLSDGSFVNQGPMWQGVTLSMGPTMVLGLKGVDVVVSTNRLQTTDLQAFRSQGIEPTTKNVLAVKSSHHFRAAYQPIARKVLVVDSGGLCSHDYRRFPFTKLRRPIWPLDDLPE
ncbi:MAG: M81 family metallopeptidase [Pseudomonadota bacterium]